MRQDGTPNTDDIGTIHPLPSHVLDAAARAVCRLVPDADGRRDVLAALKLKEPA